jgi:hypothetical protein
VNILIEALIRIIKLIPYSGAVLLLALIIFLGICIYFTIQKFRSGEEVKIFWGLIQTKTNPKVIELESICDDLRKEFLKINDNSKQKSNILKIINIVINGVIELLNASGRTDFVKTSNKLFELVLHALVQL